MITAVIIIIINKNSSNNVPIVPRSVSLPFKANEIFSRTKEFPEIFKGSSLDQKD